MKAAAFKMSGFAMLGLMATSLALALPAINATNYVTVSGSGVLIPDPAAGLKTSVQTGGATVTFPEGMVYVPAGNFKLGSGSREKTASLDAFAIGKYEVTNAEWLEFVDDTKRTPPSHWRNGIPPTDKMNHPVVWISGTDALDYCAWLSKKTGWKIALPTEAQWEKAARGPNGYAFPWGNTSAVSLLNGQLATRFNFNAVCATTFLATVPQLNYAGKTSVTTDPTTYLALGADRALPTDHVLVISSGASVSNWSNQSAYADFASSDEAQALIAAGGFTKPVGSYANGASGYGCYDMAGNVGEYAILQSGSDAKVVRGGSWYSSATNCSATTRTDTPASAFAGFRIVYNFANASADAVIQEN